MSEYADKIFLRCETRLSLTDRWRVLFGWPLLTNAEIDCEHEPGRTRSQAQQPLTPADIPAHLCWTAKDIGRYQCTGLAPDEPDLAPMDSVALCLLESPLGGRCPKPLGHGGNHLGDPL